MFASRSASISRHLLLLLIWGPLSVLLLNSAALSQDSPEPGGGSPGGGAAVAPAKCADTIGIPISPWAGEIQVPVMPCRYPNYGELSRACKHERPNLTYENDLPYGKLPSVYDFDECTLEPRWVYGELHHRFVQHEKMIEVVPPLDLRTEHYKRTVLFECWTNGPIDAELIPIPESRRRSDCRDSTIRTGAKEGDGKASDKTTSKASLPRTLGRNPFADNRQWLSYEGPRPLTAHDLRKLIKVPCPPELGALPSGSTRLGTLRAGRAKAAPVCKAKLSFRLPHSTGLTTRVDGKKTIFAFDRKTRVRLKKKKSDLLAFSEQQWNGKNPDWLPKDSNDGRCWGSLPAPSEINLHFSNIQYKTPRAYGSLCTADGRGGLNGYRTLKLVQTNSWTGRQSWEYTLPSHTLSSCTNCCMGGELNGEVKLAIRFAVMELNGFCNVSMQIRAENSCVPVIDLIDHSYSSSEAINKSEISLATGLQQVEQNLSCSLQNATMRVSW